MVGWHFSISDANLVAWLTAPDNSDGKVQLSDGDLRRAHELIMGMGWSSKDRMGLVSADRGWLEEIFHECKDYATKHDFTRFNNDEVRSQLNMFKSHFREIYLFALAVVDKFDDYERMKAFVTDCAFDSGPHALFMMPDENVVQENIKLTQPFPAFRLISEQLRSWPGVLFWTRMGKAAFASFNAARDLYQRLRGVLDNPPAIDNVLSDFARKQNRVPMLLQLSDLHFGKPEATETQEYLHTSIQSIAREYEIAQILITGDLFDNPERQHADQFRFFRRMLRDITKKDPIIIPGNHDQKVWGTGKTDFSQLIDLEWSALVTDEQLQMRFLCFDSSRDADLARGCIDSSQRRRVATMLDQHRLDNPQMRDFINIALIHHHPFTFETPTSGLWWRILKKFNWTEEDFLRMTDGEDFVEWCAARGIGLILHGHKHVPYHVRASVRFSPSPGQTEYCYVNSVGCGTSSGVGGVPISLNRLWWDPASAKWATTFWADPGDGRGLKEQEVAIRPAALTAAF